MIVTFASQKGGVGKSTVSLLLSTNLSFHKGKKIVFLDTDAPQHSIWNLREKEKEYLSNNSSYSEKVNMLYKDKECTTVVKTSLPEITSDYLSQLNERFDYVFIDVVGTVNTENIDVAFEHSDAVMIPFLLDDFSFQSTSDFLRVLYKHYGKISDRYSLICFFNRVDGRSFKSVKNQERVEAIRELSQLSNIEIMEEPIQQRTAYVTKYLSTLVPMGATNPEGKAFHAWMNEFIKKMEKINK